MTTLRTDSPTSALWFGCILMSLAWLLSGCPGDVEPEPVVDVADDLVVSDEGPDVGPDIPPPPTWTDQPGARTLSKLAERSELPSISEQETDRGKKIGVMTAYGGRIYIGYGDYSGNTGPIRPLWYDPAEGAFAAADEALSTEEVYRFHIHNGALYVPDVDPKGHEALGSVFRLASVDVDWQTMTPIADAVHTYWLASRGETLYASTASIKGALAHLASSVDGGKTWVDVHTQLSPPNFFTRFINVAATKSDLFVSGFVSTDPRTRFALLQRGDGAFEELEDVPQSGFLYGITHKDTLAIVRFSNDPGKGGAHLGSHRIEGNALVPWDDLLPAGHKLVNWHAADRLWLLTTSDTGLSLWVLDTLGNEAEHIADVGDEPFSAVAFYDNVLYLGTSLGDVWALDEVFEPLTAERNTD